MAHAPHLAHLSIANTTIDSILALRWGGFTSFAYPGLRRGEVWRGLKDLEVSILPWWDQSDSQSEKSARELRDEFRTGVRVLHGWLNTFATTGSLEVLRFGWEGCEGPNPLLLDEVVDGDRGGRWLDASEMMWEGLREVWLRGVHVDKGDVGLLKERVNGLERLMVEAGAEGETVRGRTVVEEGGEWFEVLLGDEEGLGAVDGGGEAAVEEGELGLETSEVDDLMGLLDVAVMNCLEKEGLLKTSIGTLP